MKKTVFILLLCVVLSGCGGRHAARPETANAGKGAAEPAAMESQQIDGSPGQDSGIGMVRMEEKPAVYRWQGSPTARLLDSLGYVNIVTLDPEIAVHLVYATPDNFVGEIMYDDLVEAYLLPEAAEKLIHAHRLLRENHPQYRFIVYDAARPMSVQQIMWRVAVAEGKQMYVSNPAKGGGLHNYGAAVDLSILDQNGEPLPMGTVFDHLGREANINDEQGLVAAGKLTEQELQNRLLLRGVMRAAGFTTVTSEWWHFNHCSRSEAIEKYPLIDF